MCPTRSTYYANSICQELGESKARVLPFFHAFSGFYATPTHVRLDDMESLPGECERPSPQAVFKDSEDDGKASNTEFAASTYKQMLVPSQCTEKESLKPIVVATNHEGFRWTKADNGRRPIWTINE